MGAATIHTAYGYQDGITPRVVLEVLNRWSLPGTERFELLRITYALLDYEAELRFQRRRGLPD